MNTRRILMSVAALAMLALPAAAASPVKAGKWQMTVQMDMPGMPVKMPPTTFSHCITKEEAENPKPPQQQKNSDCKVSDYKLTGNTMSWTMTCEKQNMTGKGQITYSGDSYEGSMKMTMGQQEMSAKYSGKYLGACDANDK